MKPRVLLAPVASALLGFLAFIGALVLEVQVADLIFPQHVGWDPVSLWHQSMRGRIAVVMLIGMPVLFPLVAFVVVFAYLYRRFGRRAITPPTHR